MNTRHLNGGTAHPIMPIDFEKAVLADEKALTIWQDITPLARNEWICWVESAKQESTRARRIVVGLSKMNSGMRRPCCWSGCPHREKKRLIAVSNIL